MAWYDEYSEDYGEDQDPQYPWTFAQYPDLMAARQKEEDPNDELLRWMHENQLKKKEEDDRRAQSGSDHSPWESFGSMFTVPNAIRTIGSTGGAIAGGAAGAFFGGAGAVPGAMIGSAIGGGGADALARWYAGEEQNPWASGVEAASAGLTAPLGLGLPGKAAGAKALWNFAKSQAGVGMLDAAVGANPRKMAEEGVWNKEGNLNMVSPWELLGQTAVGGLTSGVLSGVTGGAHTRYADWKGSPFDVQPPPGFKRGGGLPLEEGMPGREPIFPKLPKETQPANPATTGAGLIPPTRNVGVQDLPGTADDFSLAANVGNVAPNASQHPWVVEAMRTSETPDDYANSIASQMRRMDSEISDESIMDFIRTHPYQAQPGPVAPPVQAGPQIERQSNGPEFEALLDEYIDGKITADEYSSRRAELEQRVPPVSAPDRMQGQQIGQQALESDITPPVNLPGDVDIDAAIGRGDQAATAADNAARGRFSPQTQSARLEFEELVREIREARDLKDSLRADPIKANDAFLSRIPPTDPGTLAFLAQQGTITPQEASAIQQYQRAGREQQTRPGFNFATQNQPQGPGNLTGGYDLTTNQGIIDARQELMDGLQDGSIGAQEFKTRLDEVNAAHDRILQGDVTPGQAPPVAPPAEPEAGAVEAPPVFDVKGMAGKVEAPIPIQKEEPQISTLGQVAEGASRKIGMGATRIEGVFRAMEEELSTIADPVQRGKAKLDYIADNLSDGDIYQARLMGLISPQQDAILSQRTRNAFTDAEITGEAPEVFFPAEKASEDERAGFDSRLQAERAAGRQDWKYYSQRQIGDNPVTPKEIAQEREDIQEQFGSGDMPQAEYDERRAELDRLEADPTRMAKDPATTGPPVSDPTRPAATRPEIVIRRLSQEDLDLSNRLLSQLTETMGEANPQTDEEINGFLRRAFSNDELSDAVRLQIIDQAQADAVGKMTDPNEGPKFARTSEDRLVIGSDVRSNAMELTQGYNANLPHVMAREGLQNLLDAIRALGKGGKGKVTIKEDPTGKTGGSIEMFDNGPGMSRDELFTVYSDMNRSGKRSDTKATGGKGVGKATYILGGEHFEVRTVKEYPDGKKYESSTSEKPENFYAELNDDGSFKAGTGVEVVTKEVPDSTPTGTWFKTTLKPDQDIGDANWVLRKKLLQYSRGNEGEIIFEGRFGDEVHDGLNGKPGDVVVKQDLDLDNGNTLMDIIVPEDATEGTHNYMTVEVLNNGMWQYEDDITLSQEVSGIPDRIVIDLKPQVEELSPNYPFGTTRESVKDVVKRDIKKAVEQHLVNPRANKKKIDLVKLWGQMTTTPKGAEGNVRDSVFFDPGDRLEAPELRAVSNSPTIIKTRAVIDKFLNDILQNRGDSEEIGKLVRTGLFMGPEKYYGVHIPNPGAAQSESAILVNLWAHLLDHPNDPGLAASLFKETILHEAAHVGWRSPDYDKGLQLSAADLQDPRLGEYLKGYVSEVLQQGGIDLGHGSSFLRRLGEIYGSTGVNTAFGHTDELARILRGGAGAGGYGPEIPRLLQLYSDSRGRPAVSEDILSPTGVRSENRGPSGEKPVPGNNEPTGNGATPGSGGGILGPDGRPIGASGQSVPGPGPVVPPIVASSAPGNVPPPVSAGGGGSVPPGGMPPTGGMGGGNIPPNVPPPNPAGGFGNMPYGPAGQGRFGTAVNPIGFKTRLHAALVKAPTDAAFKWWVNHREAAQSFGALLGNKFKKFDNVSFTQYQQNPQAYPEVHDYFANWHRDLTNAGVKMGQKDNYLPQLWENPQAVAQLPQTQQNRLLLKPGFTFNAMVQNYEEGIKQGLVPKFKTISELGNFYETAARKAMADRQFFEYLKQNKLLKPRGAKGTGGWQSLNLDFFPTATLGKKPTTWVISPQFSAGKTLVKGRPRMGKEAIENYLTKDNPIYDKIANVASNLKNLRLVGGVPFTGLNAHGKNTFVRWLGSSDKRVSDFATGAGYLINPRSARRKLQSYGAALPDARAHGLTVTGEEFDADKFLRPGSPKGVLERTNHALDKVFADPLFRNIIPAMKMQRYEALASQYIQPGMNPQQMAAAKNKAAQEVNALFGGINWKELGESQHTQNLLRTFALAPDWMRTNVQGGKRMYNAILDPNSKESKMYLRLGANLLAGVVAATTLNKTMTGKWSHENDAGHEFDVVVGKDSKGKNIYVQPFGTAADFARLPLQAVKALFIDKDPGQVPQMMRNRTSIPVGQALDWYGGDFRGEKMLSDRYGKKKDYSEILKGLVDDASDLLPNPVEAPIDWMRGSTSGAEAVSRMFEAPLGFAMPKDGGGRGRKRIQRKSIR